METAHEEVLARLNKQMTLDDYRRAAAFLVENGIALRTFILLRPPGLSDQEGVDWAIRSVQFAFDQGVRCCALVPTRAGNGMMDVLAMSRVFQPPSFTAIEQSLERCVALGRGRVFMDLWDVEQFSNCPHCVQRRVERLRIINETQTIPPAVQCECTDEDEVSL